MDASTYPKQNTGTASKLWTFVLFLLLRVKCGEEERRKLFVLPS
jgi:hypothetical protein